MSKLRIPYHILRAQILAASNPECSRVIRSRLEETAQRAQSSHLAAGIREVAGKTPKCSRNCDDCSAGIGNICPHQ